MPTHAQSLYPGSSGRPSKIAIVGAGAVGTAVAYACLMRGDGARYPIHALRFRRGIRRRGDRSRR